MPQSVLDFTSGNFNLQDFQTLVTSALNSGVDYGVFSDKLIFGQSSTAWFRWSGTAFQFSTDSGVTWTDLSAPTINWVSGAKYVQGQIVNRYATVYRCIASINSSVNAPWDDPTHWSQLSCDHDVYHTSTASQYQIAIQRSSEFSWGIRIDHKGVMNISSTYRIRAPRVAVYSDQLTTISANQTYITESPIYWHCHGSRVTNPITITGPNGGLYIDHLVAQQPLTLVGNVFYQRIDGQVTGGTQLLWDSCLPQSSSTYLEYQLRAADLVDQKIERTLAELSLGSPCTVQLYNNNGVLMNGDSGVSLSWVLNSPIKLQVDLSGYLAQQRAMDGVWLLRFGAGSPLAAPVNSGLPGQVLTKTATGTQWTTI